MLFRVFIFVQAQTIILLSFMAATDIRGIGVTCSNRIKLLRITITMHTAARRYDGVLPAQVNE